MNSKILMLVSKIMKTNLENKIKSFKELQNICNQKSNQKKKIVLCHGVFDLLHIGHILHLQEAKNLGDILVVTITDQNKIFKGPKTIL